MLERVGVQSRPLGRGSPLDVVEPSALGVHRVPASPHATYANRAVPGANMRREDADVSGMDVAEPKALAAELTLKAGDGPGSDDVGLCALGEDLVLTEEPLVAAASFCELQEVEDLPPTQEVAETESALADGDDLSDDALTEEGMLLFLFEDEEPTAPVDPAFCAIDHLARQVDLESMFAARARRERMRAQAAARALPPVAPPPRTPAPPPLPASLARQAAGQTSSAIKAPVLVKAPPAPVKAPSPVKAPPAPVAARLPPEPVFAGPAPVVSRAVDLDDGPSPWAERPRRRASLLPGRAPR